MLILAHITVALIGLVVAAVSFLAPSLLKLRIVAFTTALTFISGTILVITTHSSLKSACTGGLAYLGFVLASSIFSYRKLAHATTASK